MLLDKMRLMILFEAHIFFLLILCKDAASYEIANDDFMENNSYNDLDNFGYINTLMDTTPNDNSYMDGVDINDDSIQSVKRQFQAWAGKRSAFMSDFWKRSQLNRPQTKDPTSSKRAFQSWAGKRSADAGFGTDGRLPPSPAKRRGGDGLQGFSSWAGKRSSADAEPSNYELVITTRNGEQIFPELADDDRNEEQDSNVPESVDKRANDRSANSRAATQPRGQLKARRSFSPWAGKRSTSVVSPPGADGAVNEGLPTKFHRILIHAMIENPTELKSDVEQMLSKYSGYDRKLQNIEQRDDVDDYDVTLSKKSKPPQQRSFSPWSG